MRDDHWLENKLESIWREHFSNVKQINNIIIKFGSCARTRLGSIRYHRKSKLVLSPTTEIRITGYFKDERVPEYIIDLTIAHELCHYAHGFFSPHPQMSRFPHKGGLVENELKDRGFAAELKSQKKWLKEVWPEIVGRKRRIVRRRRSRSLIEIMFGI